MNPVRYETIAYQMLTAASLLLSREWIEQHPDFQPSRGVQALIKLHDECHALVLMGEDFTSAFEETYNQELMERYINMNIASSDPTIETLGCLAMYLLCERGDSHE